MIKREHGKNYCWSKYTNFVLTILVVFCDYCAVFYHIFTIYRLWRIYNASNTVPLCVTY